MPTDPDPDDADADPAPVPSAGHGPGPVPVRVRDRGRLARSPARETALSCFEAAVAAVEPGRVVRGALALEDDRLRVADATYDLAAFDRVLVLGGGKAADGVAGALESLLGDRLAGGAVVTTGGGGDGSGTGTDGGGGADGTGEASAAREARVERRVGAHPAPDAGGVAGAARVLELARGADAGTLVLAVLTGGASALLPAPAGDLSPDDLRATTEALLAAGVDIEGTNAVRKHLSALKGGRLAAAAAPATVVTLVLSDVVGDDPSVVGSGPTVPDPSTYADARDVLDRVDAEVPGAVRARLERGAAGEEAETPGPEHPAFDRAAVHVLANGWTALDAARTAARERGYATCLLSSRLRGEARTVGPTLAAVAEEVLATGDPVAPPAVVLAGGEATVTVRGDGEGGPNAEVALSAALALDVDADVPAGRLALLAADTDGRDGGSDAAGALVDPGTVPRGDRRAARDALDRNDSLGFLRDRDCDRDRAAVVETGETGTNVNDVYVLVVAGETGADDGR